MSPERKLPDDDRKPDESELTRLALAQFAMENSSTGTPEWKGAPEPEEVEPSESGAAGDPPSVETGDLPDPKVVEQEAFPADDSPYRRP
jgi:hypothetical protein